MNALDERYRATHRLQSIGVEADPIEFVSQRIHHVTCPQVAGIAAAVCDDGSLVRGQFLDEDLRLVPTIRPGLAGGAEQHGAPARQQLGAIDPLAVSGRNDQFPMCRHRPTRA